MQKILSLVMVFVLIFSLAAYGAPATSTRAADYYKTLPDNEPYELDFTTSDNNGARIGNNRSASGKNFGVASNNVEASRVGIEIMQKGGNAFDAAVATSFAMGVVEPSMNGIGGEFVATLQLADGTTVFLDSMGASPAAASPEMYQFDEKGAVIGRQNYDGGKSVNVPGHLAGVNHMLKTYGTMTLAQVLEPVIRLCEEGWAMTDVVYEHTQSSLSSLKRYGGKDFVSIYLNELGLPIEVGGIVKNPNLAKTFKLVAERGPEIFYKGEIAEAIIYNVQTYGGLMTMKDLQMAFEEQPGVLKPVRTTYKGYEVLSTSPTGIITCQILNLFEAAEISRYEPYSAEWTNLVLECIRLANTDKLTYLGDPAFSVIPVEGLLSKEYAKARVSQIVPGQMQTYTPGDPWAFQEGDGKPIGAKGSESPNTVHISVADKEGNMISMTQTNMNTWGSKVFVDGYGFVLNDSMMNFSLDPTNPNSVGGHKKPLTNMTPTIVNKPNGELFLALGCPGATSIFQKIPQAVANFIDTGKNAEEIQQMPMVIWNPAYKIPQYWSDRTGTGLDIFKEDVVKALEKMGYPMELNTGLPPRINIVEVREDGTIWAASDPRYAGKGLAF